MDFNLLIGSIQLALAAFQFKLDNFKKSETKKEPREQDDFFDLGEAIRTLEYALTETVAFVGRTTNREPNERLALLWRDASNCIRKIEDGAELADLTFEKNLYWRNPQFYHGERENRLYRISLDNVLVQLRTLRSKYDKVQNELRD